MGKGRRGGERKRGSREKCIAQLKKKSKKPAHLLLWVFRPLKKIMLQDTMKY